MASVSKSLDISNQPISAQCLDLSSFKAMRAQSPPKSQKLLNNVSSSNEDATNSNYLAWKSTHPSAIESFDKVISNAAGKQVAVFLDYDGTLSPIVEDPDRAILSEKMREAVLEVSLNFPTAIISGRGREKVYNFVKVKDIVYCGSHGMDIMCPKKKLVMENNYQKEKNVNDDNNNDKNDKNVCNNNIDNDVNDHNVDKDSSELDTDGFTCFQPAIEFAPMMNEVYEHLKEKSKGIHGALIENNKFSISVHFRRVDEANWDDLAKIVSNELKDYPKLHTTHGRKVLEVRPVLNWNKGKALVYLLNKLGLNDSDKVLPMYIGDDRTDEDAFHALVENKIGFGILVSSIPKNTLASYSLKDTSEVMAFLHHLVKWKKSL